MLFSVNPPFNADALSQCLTVFIAGAHTRRSANQKPGGTPTRKIGVLRGESGRGGNRSFSDPQIQEEKKKTRRTCKAHEELGATREPVLAALAANANGAGSRATR